MATIHSIETNVQSVPSGSDNITEVTLSQNENGRLLYFHVLGVTIPEGSTASISGTKPDGVVYSKAGTVSGTDYVIVAEDVQMTAVPGKWDAKLHIVNGGNQIASALIRFRIDKDPVDSGAIPSDSQLDGIIAEVQAYAEEARSLAFGSPLTASTAAGMTDTNKVYVYVGGETGYITGHWYYYDGEEWQDGGIYNGVAVKTDTSLSLRGVAADSKAVGNKKVNQPVDISGQPVNGTSGQVLRTKGDGSTEWATIGLPTDEQTEQAVTEWLDAHPEATTTVQDGSITTAKLRSDLQKKIGSSTVYNVVNYGISPNTGEDVYERVFNLIDTYLSETGGILYFPSGKYIISDTIFLPSNTMLIGEGYATEIYYDGTYSSFGAGLTNGGDNVSIMNIRVNTPNTGGIGSGANFGSIGFSSYDFNSIGNPHPSSSSLSQRNTKNLFASNIYTESDYILQTETGDTYTIENVIYENIFAPKSCVSVMGRAQISGVIIKNVICSVLRLGSFSAPNVYVQADGICTGRLIATGYNTKVSNLTISDEYRYDEFTYQNVCIHVLNTLILSNAYISTSQRTTAVIERRLSKLIMSNVIVDANSIPLITNTQTSNLYDNYFTNCIFNTASSLIYGYGSNVNVQLTTTSELLEHSFRTPIIIAESDLNNYTKYGTYQCETSARAQGLTNCPTTSAFILSVFPKGAYVTQVIFGVTSIFYRTQTSGGFGSWYKLTGTVVA